MLSIHPQYIKDTNGNNLFVALPIREFDQVIEQLNGRKDVYLYDEAKNGEAAKRISIAEYSKARKAQA